MTAEKVNTTSLDACGVSKAPTVLVGGEHFEPWTMEMLDGKFRPRAGKSVIGINDMTPHRDGRVRHPAALCWENLLKRVDSVDPEWVTLSGFYRWWQETVTGDEHGPFTLNSSVVSRAEGLDRIHAGPSTSVWLPPRVALRLIEDVGTGISRKSAKHLSYDARVRGIDGVVRRRSGDRDELEAWVEAQRANNIAQLQVRYRDVHRADEWDSWV
jgi:hypothetical protein